METKRMIFVILISVLLSLSLPVRTDYVRPQPRKTLHFPWKPKHPSLPHQVTFYLEQFRFYVVNVFVWFYFFFPWSDLGLSCFMHFWVHFVEKDDLLYIYTWKFWVWCLWICDYFMFREKDLTWNSLNSWLFCFVCF